MDEFKIIIKEVSLLLKQLGLVRKRNTFYKVSDKNYGIINFQKSRDSTKEVIKFTINFGAYSDVLGRLQYGYSDSVKPGVDQCQWGARVGEFMPSSPDYWWYLKVSNFHAVISEVMEAIQSRIMPELNKRMSDEDLINSWINERHAGTTAMGRFIYLTTLLKAKGDSDTLNQIVEAFMEESKGRPNASRAIEYLKEIEYTGAN
ncbi:DUF4304 domain-containing protein [Pedobacter nutrimenti]|uniref:DUF4304 domain-containing protein n=1 Tax=Pedobacter nutrimenti TaxID=1241337 RepID=UPI002931D207|nr:DUF4304 domain-containing protein [Pedobacter nutrimenti]